jgi:type II secretion system protein N
LAAARAGGPRPLGIAGIALACAALTLLFVLLRFPFDLLGRRVAAELERASGAEIAFATLEPRLTVAGPGLAATGVRVAAPGGPTLAAESVRLRPAWSLSWLRLAPALHLELEGLPGTLAGVVTLGAQPGFAGELAAVDLAHLPLASFWPGLALSGSADAQLDLRSGEAGPAGDVALQAAEGTLQAPALPFPVPFQKLEGRLRLGDGNLLEVTSLEATGPLFSASVTGRIGQAPRAADAPLDLVVDFEVGPPFRPGLESLGVRVGRDGKGRLQIAGTPAAPIVQ